MNGSLQIGGLEEILDGLKAARSKFEDTHLRLQERYKVLFGECVAAQTNKNKPQATIYANECTEVKKLSRAFGQIISNLDQAIKILEKIPSNPTPVNDF